MIQLVASTPILFSLSLNNLNANYEIAFGITLAELDLLETNSL